MKLRSAFAFAVALGVTLPASGCVLSTPREPTSEEAAGPASSTRVGRATTTGATKTEKKKNPHADHFPETLAMIERAEQELLAGHADGAAVTAEQARVKYFDERKALKSAGSGATYDYKIAETNSRATQSVTFQRIGVVVAAEWEQGHHLRALAALHDHSFHPGFCGKPIEGKCKAVWLSMKDTYPHLWAPRRVELRLMPVASMDRFLSTDQMEMTEGFLKEGPGQYVVYAFPTELSKTKNGGVEAAMRGSPGSVMTEQCTKVGRVRIQDADFDVSRCKDVRENLTPANAKLRIAAETSVLVASRKKGEAIALLIDSANVKRKGNTWDLGEARAFWTGTIKDQTFGDSGD